MEYYGKILCISKEDLTRDDRPAGDKAPDVLAPIMSVSCYDQMASRGRICVVSKGIGRGNRSLASVESLPEKYRKRVVEKYGDMRTEILRNWFAAHWEIDRGAQSFYAGYSPVPGRELLPEQQQEYTLNASAIRAVLRLMEDTGMERAVRRMGRVCWAEMAGAINFYQAEFGHTLPLSVNRFRKKVNEFKEKGYAALVSRKFGNQNTRVVNYHIERLLVSIAARMNRPWNVKVHEMYTQFVRGELEIFDPETGEIYDPANYRDKEGNPVEVSPSTVQYYLTLPKNMALIKKQHMSWITFMHEERPHVHRNNPDYAFSLVSFDDRDLPRSLDDTKERLKAYYAYDVASQCIVGYAYSRRKNAALVVDMFRSMFRLIERQGWGVPGQVEVEHHLMSKYKEGFLKAGEVFKFVRFCAPQNSQEKHAEQFNGAKKRSIEHEHQLGIGRFYAKQHKYRTESKKVSDEKNDTYEDREYYSMEELIADDQETIRLFNASPHPNQKKYPGMSRWEVLCSSMNPDLRPYRKSYISKYIGEHVKTSIRRNSYCRVNHTDFWLSSPEVIGRLAPNNYKVDAYYIPEEDGTVKDVYIYQNGMLIDKLVDMGRFNTAAMEQTDEDRRIMEEQLKFGKAFDRMLEREAVTPVGILPKAAADQVASAPAKEAFIPEKDEDTDFMDYDTAKFRQEALNSL